MFEALGEYRHPADTLPSCLGARPLNPLARNDATVKRRTDVTDANVAKSALRFVKLAVTPDRVKRAMFFKRIKEGAVELVRLTFESAPSSTRISASSVACELAFKGSYRTRLPVQENPLILTFTNEMNRPCAHTTSRQVRNVAAVATVLP